jgi:hypothetical protein
LRELSKEFNPHSAKTNHRINNIEFGRVLVMRRIEE